VTQKQLQEYRQRLLDLVRRLRGEVRAIRDAALEAARSHASVGNADAIPGDLADMSIDQVRQDTEIALHETERRILNEADEALERIKHGTYGNCQECGRRIATERLDVIPYTPYCVECARKVEESNTQAAV
jgi:RNA polymerase-binding protein DksA